MPLVTTAELGGAARSAGTGVGAFNAITLEHAEGIVAGAESVGQPVILQISQNTVRFHLGRYGRSPRRPARSPRQHWCRCPSISTTSRTPSSLTRPQPRASAPSCTTPPCSLTTTTWPRPAEPATGPMITDCGSKPNWARWAPRAEHMRREPAQTRPRRPHTWPRPVSTASPMQSAAHMR